MNLPALSLHSKLLSGAYSEYEVDARPNPFLDESRSDQRSMVYLYLESDFLCALYWSLGDIELSSAYDGGAGRARAQLYTAVMGHHRCCVRYRSCASMPRISHSRPQRACKSWLISRSTLRILHSTRARGLGKRSGRVEDESALSACTLSLLPLSLYHLYVMSSGDAPKSG